MRKTIRGDAGFAVLLMELLAMVVLLTLLAISAPSWIALKAASEQQEMVWMLKRVRNAEMFHTQIYNDGFRSPGALASVRTWPATCEASGLLDGAPALPKYQDYTLTFTGNTQLGTAANGCLVSGYTDFSYTAIPVAGGLESKWLRYSFYLGSDLTIRYALMPAIANATSAPYPY